MFSIKIRYLHYFQLMAATSSAEVASHEQLLYSTCTVSLSPESALVNLGNMRCKHCYKMLNKNSTVQLTGVHQNLENQFYRRTFSMEKQIFMSYSDVNKRWNKLLINCYHRIPAENINIPLMQQQSIAMIIFYGAVLS